MTNDCWQWTTEKVIPSDTDAGRRILCSVIEELTQRNWPQHDIFSIHLALEEAIVNAVEHGNRQDPSKQVRVCCKLSEDRLWIEITDEGGGFDPDTLPDPTAPENIECPRGRGIMLMRNFMSRVEYNAAGNCVVMEKERCRAS